MNLTEARDNHKRLNVAVKDARIKQIAGEI